MKNRTKILAIVLALCLISTCMFSSGSMAEAGSGTWKHNSKGYWYSYSDGSYAKNQWLLINGKWYYFNSSGYMKTGWLSHGGKWYYLSSSGAMQTGWKKVSGKWYFFDRNGVMVTGKVSIGGKEYYFDANGVWIESSASDSTANTGIAVGDTIVFGDTEQDNNLANGKEPIEWKVLAKEGNRILLLSKYALDFQKIDGSFGGYTWETCTLREWLNDAFFTDAFSEEEQKKIVTVSLPNPKNPVYGTSDRANTKDRVFLLSVDEAVKYLNLQDDGSTDAYYRYKGDCSCSCTEYAFHHRRWDSLYDTRDCEWWLRTTGSELKRSATAGGSSIDVGGTVGTAIYCAGVRPAIWITP